MLGEDPGDGRPSVAARRERVLAELAQPAPEPRVRAASELSRCTTAIEHGRRIERVREAIAAGEVYQANVAHRMLARVEGEPLDSRGRPPIDYAVHATERQRSLAYLFTEQPFRTWLAHRSASALNFARFLTPANVTRELAAELRAQLRREPSSR